MFSSNNSQVANDAVFVEDVFSNFLYTGNGSTQTINNGIDLAGKGGMVWTKARTTTSAYTFANALIDTMRGVGVQLCTDRTDANYTQANSLTAFNADGYTLGTDSGGQGRVNNTSYGTQTYASWTFRKQPKFYTQGTYTGTGSVQNITHDLGSVPAFIIVKDTTNNGSAWAIYHTSLGNTKYLQFTTDAAGTSSGYWNNTSPTSTQFTVGTNGNVNQSGATFVYYAFASDAGGFGLTGTDNVISCGSFTDSGGVNTINLGYEPQWILIKSSSETNNWAIVDTMRGLPADGSDRFLFANSSAAESGGGLVNINATGFYSNATLSASATYIYIAIRRGPMKVPTSGTTVFTPITYNGNGTSQTITGSVGVPDLGLGIGRTGGAAGSNAWYDRLRGKELALRSTTTSAQYDASPGGEGTMTNVMNGMRVENTYGILNDASTAYILYFMSRAPSFFDEVCYTGTGSARTVAHNLGVAPELMIVKNRSGATNWLVYSATLGPNYPMFLNATSSGTTNYGATFFNSTTPTSSVFSLGTDVAVNDSGGVNYVAYLFATCAGVQYINSYVGDGTTGRTINCGFTGGARFVCIKANSTTGSWWTFDSARGIVTNNDPALQLNSTAAEVTSADAIDTASSGFIVNQEATCSLNASGVTYLVWAIA